MNTIDIFAGAGGLSEGFRRNGFNIVSHIEKDKAASLTLKTREAFYHLLENNKVDIYIDYLKGDITRDKFYSYIPKEIFNKVINEEINDSSINKIFNAIDKELASGNIDLIIGGPPCQAYSRIGISRDKYNMENDPRRYLYKLYKQFLEKYKPKMFVFENVLGLLSVDNGNLFKQIKKEFMEVGYELDYRVLNSLDFGVLQNRKRIILIGWRRDLCISYPSFDYKISKGNVNDLFYDLPKIPSDYNMEVGNYIHKPNKLLQESQIRHSGWNLLTQHTSRKLNERDKKIYEIQVNEWNKGNRLKYNELPKYLITHSNTSSFLDRFKVIDGNSYSHTIVAHLAKDGHHFIHPDISQNRSITVREAARLQSFPDDFYFETCRTEAFKQIGNAVPPLMAEGIAKSIYSLLKNSKPE